MNEENSSTIFLCGPPKDHRCDDNGPFVYGGDAKSLYLSRSPSERREFLEKLVSNLILDGSSVRFDFKKPFGVLAKMNESEKWRTLIDEFRTQLGQISDF